MTEPGVVSTIDAIEDDRESPPGTDASARPIFIVGSLRSGASILFASLAQHPRLRPVTGSGWITYLAAHLQRAYEAGIGRRATSQLDIMGVELEDFYVHFGEAIDALLRREWERTLPVLSENGGRSAAIGAIDGLAAGGGPEAPRWLDASPDTCFHIVGLLRLFPRAKFVHVLRDADSVVRTLTDQSLRAVYRSQFQDFTEEAAYEHWLDAVTACVAAEQAFGSDTIVRIRRDDLVGSPEPTLRACLGFLDLPFAEACLRPIRP